MLSVYGCAAACPVRHIACASHAAWGWDVQKGLGGIEIKKKVLMDGLKEKMHRDVRESMICCMSGLSLSCVTKHTRTSLCHLWVGVCLSIVCFNFKPTRPIKDQTNKRKPKVFPSLGLQWLFLVYWFIIWSVLFSLWTSKPLGGALDSSSCCSSCPLVSSVKAQDCQFNQPVRSFGCLKLYIDSITVMK